MARRRDASFPAPADALYVVLYPAMIAALVIFVRARTGWHTPTVLDAAVLATSAALLSWIYFLGPLATTHDTTLARAVGLAYPVMDLLVLAVALRLTLGPGPRTVAYYLLAGSLLMTLVSDTIYLVQRLADSYTETSPVAFGYIAASVLLGTAALHPSMLRIDERSAVLPLDATVRRIAMLATAALVAPTVLAVQYLLGTLRDVLVIAAACALLFVLVLIRMAGLVAAQRAVAVTDGLTGLYSRRYFEPALLESTQRGRAPVGVVLVDVDHFKAVNDQYGHQTGDRVLCEVAKRLRAACRADDVVARYGGEEFAALLPGVDAVRLATMAETVRGGIANVPIVVADTELWITASIGIAVAGVDATLPDDVIRLADQALYAAKGSGRNRVVAASTLDITHGGDPEDHAASPLAEHGKAAPHASRPGGRDALATTGRVSQLARRP